MTEKRFNIHLSEDAETMWVSDVKTHKEIDFGHFQNAKLLTNLLNELNDENEQLKKRIECLERKIDRERKSNIIEHEKWEKEVIELIREQRKFIDDLNKENEQLKKELFEARKDYLIETADISDKLYLDEMIETERKEIFK